MPAKIASMMPLASARPYLDVIGQRDPLRAARAIDVEADAGDDQQDEDERERAQEEAGPPKAERLMQRRFGDRPEYDTDDEGRARPLVVAQDAGDPAQHDEDDEVPPGPLAEIAAQDAEQEDEGYQDAGARPGQLAEPGCA